LCWLTTGFSKIAHLSDRKRASFLLVNGSTPTPYQL
jgi:hypothetical protein